MKATRSRSRFRHPTAVPARAGVEVPGRAMGPGSSRVAASAEAVAASAEAVAAWHAAPAGADEHAARFWKVLTKSDRDPRSPQNQAAIPRGGCFPKSKQKQPNRCPCWLL